MEQGGAASSTHKGGSLKIKCYVFVFLQTVCLLSLATLIISITVNHPEPPPRWAGLPISMSYPPSTYLQHVGGVALTYHYCLRVSLHLPGSAFSLRMVGGRSTIHADGLVGEGKPGSCNSAKLPAIRWAFNVNMIKILIEKFAELPFVAF